MILIQSLSKKFGKNQVLSNLDLTIDKGGVYAVLGPNGSGKTTLIKCILGMAIPDSGTITVFDFVVKKNAAYRKQIQYMPQIANFPANLSVAELFRMIKDLKGTAPNEAELVEIFGLAPYLNKKFSTLSGGTRQKVNIALSFMFDAPLVILDEPTTGLDPASLIKLKSIINAEKDKGKTILITSHIMQIVEELADEVIYLLEGSIYFKGSTNALKQQTGQDDFEHAIAAIALAAHA